MNIQNIQILGLGYMGLPMAAIAAKAGYSVTGVDVQQHVIDSVNARKAHFEETGLSALMADVAIKAVRRPEAADVHVIAVPTPFIEETKQPDMVYVRAAAASLAPILRAGDLVILESTSPVGASETHVKDVIEAENPAVKDKIHYAFCPERAIPGDTLRELVENDRCVGGLTEEATQKALKFYAKFITGELLPTHIRVAEMVKLVENTSRDAQIAFANELGHVCDTLGLNVYDVIALANRHPRVNILRPGTGVGGHCIAVDPWFIIRSVDEKMTPFLQQARKTNDAKPHQVVARILQLADENPTAKIALMGLAFKPDVDDLRNSPAMQVATAVQAVLPHVQVCEPNIKAHDNFNLVSLKAVQGADILVFLTAHTPFKTLEHTLEHKIIYDPAGTFDGRI